MAVAIVTHVLAAFSHLEELDATPPMEFIIPPLSKLAIGVRHQGWQMLCEPVTIPGIPTKHADTIESSSQRPGLHRIHTQEGLPYSQGLSLLLKGQISRRATPAPCSAMWLWKTQAAHIKDGKVVAVRPDSDRGGLGCGPSVDGEKVMLLLAGSGIDRNGPFVCPLAWTVTRQSGLRMLIVKIRKMRKDSSSSGQFSASLQDALAGYAYLVDRLGFLPRNITLLGEGIGASLCISLTLYLSSLSQTTESAIRLGRPGKVLLYSPWCDMTVSSDILLQHSYYDVVDLESQLRSRSRYIAAFDKCVNEEKMEIFTEDICSRYESEDGLDLDLLGSELADTIEAFGSRHPLVSPGMPIACNEYTKQAMQLLSTKCGPPLGVLICSGSAEVHITEARTLAANLSSVDGIKLDYIEGEDKVTNFSFITASQANSRVDGISQTFLST